MSPLVIGVVFGFGVLVVYDALVRPDRRSPHARKPRALPAPLSVLSCIGGGLAGMVATSWPIATIGCALAGARLPRSIRRGRQERVRIERREALAALSGRLRDAIRSGIGLSDALSQAAASAPASLAPALRRMVGHAQIAGLSQAAVAFGEEVDDPAAHLLTAALVYADRLGSRNLAEVLDSLAEATAAQASTVREARSRQTRARTSARIVAAVPILLLLAIRHTNPAYLQPYQTALGQAVLAFALGLIALGYGVMRRIARVEGA